MAERLNALIQTVSQSAARNSVRTLVVAAQDPDTGELRVVASPGAMAALKRFVAEKFGLIDPSAPNGREAAAALLGDASESDTGWPEG